MIAAQNEKATLAGGFLDTANQSACNSTPSYPVRGTQQARLLAVLLHGEKVHPLRAWRALGIYRLSDTVFSLRCMGWPIVTGRLNVANRFNEQCHVAEYHLEPAAIASAGHGGKEFAWREIELMQAGDTRALKASV